MHIKNYLKEIASEVELNLAPAAEPGEREEFEIDYLAPPPVYIPQLKKGIAFMYGGTQFGDYQDLGDGRSCMVDDDFDYNVIIAKGCLTTPYTKFGNGDYSLRDAHNCLEIQEKLIAERISTEKTLAIYKVDVTKATVILRRSCPYRIGTFEYVNRHHPDLVKKLWLDLIQRIDNQFNTTKYGSEPDTLLYFREIVNDYGWLCRSWHEIGFVHGCLNTDNMLALPTGIDYSHSFFSFDDKDHSEIDMTGRYSRENQENAILFGLNKYRLCLQSLFPDYTADDMYKDFKD